ncbi:MAG TPA: DNA topoisomerase IB [Burkholderiales bacterium]|jgi:DNA topoisomerase-1
MSSYTCRDPARSAQAAGLRYVSDSTPGISRVRAGSAFRYSWPDGRPVREREVLARIKALAIPPAWESVWICPRGDGHIQATGRDARARKQYRYHRRWREVRDETKYGRMPAFASALSRIRRRVREDLALPGLPRDKVLATVVRLLEATRMRVGNEEYARANQSFGLTTLRTRQVRLQGSKMQFRFRGKSGVWHVFALCDRRLAAIVRRMRDLPGYELFQYVDGDGVTRAVDSDDVNAYLKGIAGEEFTSKDFRTWAGTVLAAQALQRVGKSGLSRAIEEVARALGNTKAVCRNCYIHPAIIEAHRDGTLAQALHGRSIEARVKRLLGRSRKPGSLVPVLRKSLRRLGRRAGTDFAARTAHPLP